MSVRHRLEYALLRSVVFLVGLLPASGARWVGRGLGDFTFSVLRIRRRVTMENLSQAFPDWDPARVEGVARDCYRHFGITFLELARFPAMQDDDIRRLMTLVGEEHLERATRSGHGLVLCTGHFGNWEALGARVALQGHPIWVAAKTQSNPAVDAYVTAGREVRGMRVLKVEEGFRRMLRPLRDGEFMTFLFDQDAGRRGIFVEFFGRPASTPVGVVRFARMTRSPIVSGYSVRQPDGTYVAQLEPPILVREDLPAEEAEREALERLVAQLENKVREHPEHWFWMHRRWKTRPPEAVTGTSVVPREEAG
ncbi:MAG: lysophospholipid acyltransferase family protein [Candidatus Eisenbacteria bacterium]